MAAEFSEGAGDPGLRDLWGNPVAPPRDRRGRPSYAKTPENAREVARLAACGWSQDMIAAVLGCDVKTLRKHFSRELEHGALLVEAEALAVLEAQMRAGKVGAAKAILERMDGGGRRKPQPVKPAAPAPKPKPLGKKEARQAESEAGRDELVDLLPPGLRGEPGLH